MLAALRRGLYRADGTHVQAASSFVLGGFKDGAAHVREGVRKLPKSGPGGLEVRPGQNGR